MKVELSYDNPEKFGKSDLYVTKIQLFFDNINYMLKAKQGCVKIFKAVMNEGEDIDTTEHILLEDLSEEIFEKYWSISLRHTHSVDESFEDANKWQLEVVFSLNSTLTRLGFKVEVLDPEEHEKNRQTIIDILKGKDE